MICSCSLISKYNERFSFIYLSYIPFVRTIKFMCAMKTFSRNKKISLELKVSSSANVIQSLLLLIGMNKIKIIFDHFNLHPIQKLCVFILETWQVNWGYTSVLILIENIFACTFSTVKRTSIWMKTSFLQLFINNKVF